MSRKSLVLTLGLLALTSCGSDIAEFWRPISEPNLQMPLDRAQKKLEFDLGQCHCGIYPSNTPQSDLIGFQPDEQRMVATGIFGTRDDSRNCVQRPSLVVAECMRARGWEVTKCTGRMKAGQGSAICALTELDDE
jgi:hypothetical protein